MLRFAVLGDPVAHSRSPAIHEILLGLADLTGEYTAVRADPEVLADMVSGLRMGEWDGFNVTMPLKGDAAAAADVLSDDAARAGSVNTLLMVDGAVMGESTDCTTFRTLVESLGFDGSEPVLVLGAGGAAAAALAAIGTSRKVYVSARRRERALDLAGRLGGEVLEWGTAVAGCLLVNATPLGMRGESLPVGLLDVVSGLIDLAYGPTQTPSITSAGRLGIPSIDGHEFLFRQAVSSFTLWTGVDLVYERVAAALRKT